MNKSAKKILIVDDDLTALDIVDLLFEDAGFEVEGCTDGAAALARLESFAPAIILVDLMMPGMSGQNLVRIIRERQWQGPIIAFTAMDDPLVHRDALDAGCSLVLTKPCRPTDLVEHVKRLAPT